MSYSVITYFNNEIDKHLKPSLIECKFLGISLHHLQSSIIQIFKICSAFPNVSMNPLKVID